MFYSVWALWSLRQWRGIRKYFRGITKAIIWINWKALRPRSKRILTKSKGKSLCSIKSWRKMAPTKLIKLSNCKKDWPTKGIHCTMSKLASNCRSNLDPVKVTTSLIHRGSRWRHKSSKSKRNWLLWKDKLWTARTVQSTRKSVWKSRSRKTFWRSLNRSWIPIASESCVPLPLNLRLGWSTLVTVCTRII